MVTILGVTDPALVFVSKGKISFGHSEPYVDSLSQVSVAGSDSHSYG